MISTNEETILLPTATKMAELEEETVPSVLLPCASCSRTFRPEALNKHSKYCEKTLIKKRKVFDSAKQRIQGTDLAEFLPVLTHKKKSEKSPVRKTQSKWKEKHMELVRAIRAARTGPAEDLPAAPVKPCDHEKCPHCDRYFGPKAYDRHLEWCKEHSSRIQPKSPASVQAKERLEARTKYRAPLLAKSRRAIVREKYQLGGSQIRDPSPMGSNQKNISNRLREPSPAERLQRNVNNSPKQTPTVKGDSNANDSFSRQQPLRNSRRNPSPMKKTSTPVRSKRVEASNNNNNNSSIKEKTVKADVSVNVDSSPQDVIVNCTPKEKDDIFSASCNITSIKPKATTKHNSAGANNCIVPNRHNSSPTSAEVNVSVPRRRFPRRSKPPVLNSICVNDDVMGMTVFPCRPITCSAKCCTSKNSNVITDSNIKGTLIETINFSDCMRSFSSMCIKDIGNDLSRLDVNYIKPKNLTKESLNDDFSVIEGDSVFNDHCEVDSLNSINESCETKQSLEVTSSIINLEADSPDMKLQDSWDPVNVIDSNNLHDINLEATIYDQHESPLIENNSMIKNRETFYDVKKSNFFDFNKPNELKFGFVKKKNCEPCAEFDIKAITYGSSSESGTEFCKISEYEKVNDESNNGIFNDCSEKVMRVHYYDSLNQLSDCNTFDKKLNTLSDDLFGPSVKRRKYSSSQDLTKSAEVLYVSGHLKTDSSVSYSYNFCKRSSSCDNLNFQNENSMNFNEENYNIFYKNMDMELCEDCHRSRSDSDLRAFNKNVFKCCLNKKNKILKVQQAFIADFYDDRSTRCTDMSSELCTSCCERDEQCENEKKENHIDCCESNCEAGNENLVNEYTNNQTDSASNDCNRNRSMTFLVCDESPHLDNVENEHFLSGNNVFKFGVEENENCVSPYNVDMLSKFGETYETGLSFNKQLNNDGASYCNEPVLLNSLLKPDELKLSDLDTGDLCNEKEITQSNRTNFCIETVEKDTKLLTEQERSCDEEITLDEDDSLSRGDKMYSNYYARDNERFIFGNESSGDRDDFIFNKNYSCVDENVDTLLVLISGPTLLPDNEKSPKIVEVMNEDINLYKNRKNVKPLPSVTVTDCEINTNDVQTDFDSKKCLSLAINPIAHHKNNNFNDEISDFKCEFENVNDSCHLYNNNYEQVSSGATYLEYCEQLVTEECVISYSSEVNCVRTHTWRVDSTDFERDDVIKGKKSFLPPIDSKHPDKQFSGSFPEGKKVNPKLNGTRYSLNGTRRNESKIPKLTNWQIEAEKNLTLPPVEIAVLPPVKKNHVKNNTPEPLRLPQLVVKGNSIGPNYYQQNLRNHCSLDNYDPYKSAERQMNELLGLEEKVSAAIHHHEEGNKMKNQPLISVPPADIISSPTSAFAKFTPIQSPVPSDDDNDNKNCAHPPSNFNDAIGSKSPPITLANNNFDKNRRSSLASSEGDFIRDKNQNPISLSSLSLCSTISIDSIDSYKNSFRKGVSASAKVQSCDKRVELPLKRSISAVEPHRKGRDFLRGNLKMEDLLYGFSDNHYDRFLGTPVTDINKNENDSFENLALSNESLKKSDSVDETSRAEQELLKSMSEFEKLFESPSLKPIPPLIPSSSPAPAPKSLGNMDSPENNQQRSQQLQSGNKFCSDSAYNSLNRKSPQLEDTATIENYSSSGSECSFPPIGGQNSHVARFCHECGAKYPVIAAKFCCQCGVKRLVI